MKKFRKVSIMSKVFRILVISALICSGITFAVLIINALMGVVVIFEWYAVMAIASTLILAFGMILYDSKNILRKSSSVSYKSKNGKRVRSATKGKTSQRRKIS